MDPFVFAGQAARVLFGTGTTSSVAEECARLAIDKALVVTTPQQHDLGQHVVGLLGSSAAGHFDQAAMHTPTDVTKDALEVFRASGANGVVAIGGGSTTGLSKAIALHTDAPQVVLPTSYAGSEMTNILGQTEAGKKTTQSSTKVLPETVIYDVEHTLGMPARMSVTSGLNAIAHAVEAQYAPGANPVLCLLAEEGIAKLASALDVIADTPADLPARRDALYGAWLCAMCLASGGIALHHKLCHLLGGTFDLPHAETHAIILPHAVAFNANAAPDTMSRLARALNSENVPGRLFDIMAASEAPTSLRQLGLAEQAIPTAARQACAAPYPNPRALEVGAIETLLRDAWEGVRPGA